MKSRSFSKLSLSFLCVSAWASAVNGQALLIDFNSTNQGGGPTNASGYQAYDAGHEVETDFIARSYAAFGTTISLTPTWPETSSNAVQQMIDRATGNDNNWGGSKLDLITDFIGIDTRTGNGGNGDYDGTTGTATSLLITLSGVPADEYAFLSYHHDTENVHTDFLVEISTNEGATFTIVPGPNNDQTFSMTSSSPNGNPANPDTQDGVSSPASGDPRDLFSTVNHVFDATGDDIIIRYTPYANTAVHKQIFALNGIELAVTGDTDGDGMPDIYESVNGLDPETDDANDDLDNDGLTNIQEYQGANGTPGDGDETNPNDEDSDNDGLTDGEEVNTYSSNPNLSDSDGDFFSDYDEINASPATSPNDPNSFPVSSTGFFLDFSGTANGGPFNNTGYLPYVSNDQEDGGVNQSQSYPAPGLGDALTEIEVEIDFPLGGGNNAPNTVTRAINRSAAQAARYSGRDVDMIRDWIGVDSRAANGGGGTTDPTQMRISLTGLPAGKYLYLSHHHDVDNQNGSFDVLLTDANNTNTSVFSKFATSGLQFDVASGETAEALPSTTNMIIESSGVDTPVVITYQIVEPLNNLNETIATQSFIVVNGLEITPVIDSDGDLIPDLVENAIDGLDSQVADATSDLDQDNLNNLFEYYQNTAIDSSDTDRDDLADGIELIAEMTNPFLTDTDGDGLTDGQEINEFNSSPLLTDSDGDNFSDSWEALAGSDLSDGATIPDQDLDGYSQFSDPNDGDINSFPMPLPNQLFVDFNSSQNGGGDSFGFDPEDSEAFLNQRGYASYHANHEEADQFTAGTYEAFGVNVTVTPTWPDSGDNRVMQSIGRVTGNNDNWHGDRVNLLEDWLGIDTRPENGGNGDYDGTTGSPTRMLLTLGNLPAASYTWRSYHHDTENVHAPFLFEISTDGGATYTVISGPNNDQTFPMTDSTNGGTPASPIRYQGAEDGFINPEELPSTVNAEFSASGSDDVVLRFTPYANTGVHRRLFGINGFELTGPGNPLGSVQILATAKEASGEFLMLVKGLPSRTYLVEKSVTLSGDWAPLEPEVTVQTDGDGDGLGTIPATQAAEAKAFYRLVEQ